MLRTNHSFLAYIEQLYERQGPEGEIVIRSFQAGQRLLEQGKNAPGILFIREGITKCYFTEENTKDYILEFLGSGEIIGDLEIVRDIPCLCTIEAITPVTAYAFPKVSFSQLLKKDIALNHLLITSFAERIINTSSRASYQQLYTVENSLGRLLELQAKQGIQLSKEDLASYLGITVRSLNRALKNLNKKNLEP